MCGACARSSADPDGVSAQIDLIGVPWLNIGFEPSAAVRRHCAVTQQAVGSHSATALGTLGWRPKDGLLGRLVGVVKDCGTHLSGRARARVAE
jgi:hypothetical protein